MGLNKMGFTLIELLVVVAIIGILAAIAIPAYLGIQGKAKCNSMKSNFDTAGSYVMSELLKGSSATADAVADLNAGGKKSPWDPSANAFIQSGSAGASGQISLSPANITGVASGGTVTITPSTNDTTNCPAPTARIVTAD